MEDPEPTHAGRLQGRRIVVTGAASGIGLATARLFAAEAAKLALLDRDAVKLAAVSRSLGAIGIEVDITSGDAVESAVESAEAQLGGLDGLVNAAGIMASGAMDQMPVDLWRRIVEVNLIGSYLVARSCIAPFRRSGSGTIVNLASGRGLLPNAPDLTAYSASKGGVVALGRALAAELAPDIRVNTVCPGLVDTPMADGHRANVGNYALKRIAAPDEIARAILFLTSSDASYVTGAALAVDGGRSFH